MNRLAAAASALPGADAGRGLRVLIADADGLARSMMRFALSNSERIAAVHGAGNAREALELARYFRPGVAIVDAVVPREVGSNLFERSCARSRRREC